jgi:hypothetical protein
MEMENDAFLDLVGGQRRTLEEGIRQTLETLTHDGVRERVETHEDRFLPGVLTDD